MKPGYEQVGDYEVLPPITPFNRGYLEGAAWQRKLMDKDVEALKRHARILELKLLLAREHEGQVLERYGGGVLLLGEFTPESRKLHEELHAMNLTPEEQAL